MVKELRPVLCVVAGPNGSGKTSTTEKLLANEWTADSVYINPDNIAQDNFGDWNSLDAVMKAAKEATRLRYDCLERKVSFVFETVFSYRQTTVGETYPSLLARQDRDAAGTRE